MTQEMYMAAEPLRICVGARVVLAVKSVCMVLSAALALTLLHPVAAAEDYVLSAGQDATKVTIESANLTAAMPFEWPRIIFHHTVDPFSPTFDVGIPRLYLYNDTDGDGRFCRAEAVAVVPMDSNHVTWNVSAIEQGYSTESGQYARFSMSCNLSAYALDENDTLMVADFASVSSSFSITELASRHENSEGPYTVMGRDEISCSLCFRALRDVDATGLVVDQWLQGGGTTSMFLIKESGDLGEVTYTEVSGREDETEFGEDFAHALMEASDPRQEFSFSKEDGTVQASYFLSSVATLGDGNETRTMSTYYSTGSGLVVDTVLPILNESTSPVILNMSALLDEAGFVGGVKDWVELYLPYFIAFVAAVASLLLVMWHIRMRRKRLQLEKEFHKKKE